LGARIAAANPGATRSSPCQLKPSRSIEPSSFGSAVVYWAGVWIQARRIRRRTGRSTNSRPRGTKERLLWQGGSSSSQPGWRCHFLSGRAAALPGVAIISALVHPSFRALGILMMVGGYAGTLWCYAAMGTAWRMGINREEKPTLVMAGPYRVVRHPIYFFRRSWWLRSCFCSPRPRAGGACGPSGLREPQGGGRRSLSARTHGADLRGLLCSCREMVPAHWQSSNAGGSRAPETCGASHEMSKQPQPENLTQGLTLAGKAALVTGGSRGIGGPLP